LKYFERAGWQTNWINAAEEIVRAEFNRSYADQPIVDDSVAEIPLPAMDKKVCNTKNIRAPL
jgi:hypothetical protein